MDRWLYVGHFVSVVVGRLLLLNWSESVNVGESQWFGRSRSVSVSAAIGPFFESVVDQSLWVALSVLVDRFHLICK